jgi:hypothetical protein
MNGILGQAIVDPCLDAASPRQRRAGDLWRMQWRIGQALLERAGARLNFGGPAPAPGRLTGACCPT